jgi:hypothetical protein
MGDSLSCVLGVPPVFLQARLFAGNQHPYYLKDKVKESNDL